MSDTVKQLEKALEQQPVNPLRHNQVTEYRAESKRLRDIVNAPPYVQANRGEAAKRAKIVDETISTHAAKPVSGAEKDRVAKLAQAVMDETIRPALLPREDMRRNPAGSVGRFLNGENSTPIQHAIQQWKRAQLAIEQDNPDPDLANVERFRPERIHDTGGTSTFMANAQIPGHFAMTPAAKENWPADMPPQGTVNSPLAQVQKREMSEKQKASLAKAQAAAAAKRAAKESM